MKGMICVCLAAMVVAVAVADEGDKYTTKYDNIDLDEILNNKILLERYCGCLLDEIKCTPEGTELKSHMHEGLSTGCAKCTDKHREAVKKVCAFLINNRPDLWKKLSDKYDPEGEFTKKYEKELKEIKKN